MQCLCNVHLDGELRRERINYLVAGGARDTQERAQTSSVEQAQLSSGRHVQNAIWTRNILSAPHAAAVQKYTANECIMQHEPGGAVVPSL